MVRVVHSLLCGMVWESFTCCRTADVLEHNRWHTLTECYQATHTAQRAFSSHSQISQLTQASQRALGQLTLHSWSVHRALPHRSGHSMGTQTQHYSTLNASMVSHGTAGHGASWSDIRQFTALYYFCAFLATPY